MLWNGKSCLMFWGNHWTWSKASIRFGTEWLTCSFNDLSVLAVHWFVYPCLLFFSIVFCSTPFHFILFLSHYFYLFIINQLHKLSFFSALCSRQMSYVHVYNIYTCTYLYMSTRMIYSMAFFINFLFQHRRCHFDVNFDFLCRFYIIFSSTFAWLIYLLYTFSRGKQFYVVSFIYM